MSPPVSIEARHIDVRDTSRESSPLTRTMHEAGATATRARFRDRPPQIIYSTLSTQSIKRLVHRHYDFKDSLECVLYQRGVNDIYLLSSGEYQFALRLSRSNWRSREAISGELTALKHLSLKGVDVALPLSRRDGDTITEVSAPEGLRRAVLFSWAKGQTPKYTEPAHALRYGRLLSALHTAAEDLPPTGSRPELDLNYLLCRPMELIRPRLKRLPAAWKRLESLVGRMRRQFTSGHLRLSDWGFCHGDVHGSNARIDGDRLVLFDFDSCGSGWRVFDLASYRWEARRQCAETEAWGPFVKGYLQLRPAAVQFMEFVGLFMILKHLWTTGQWIVLSAESGISQLPDDFFEDLVPYCEAIERETVATPY